MLPRFGKRLARTPDFSFKQMDDQDSATNAACRAWEKQKYIAVPQATGGEGLILRLRGTSRNFIWGFMPRPIS
jgi:hypothetical protein